MKTFLRRVARKILRVGKSIAKPSPAIDFGPVVASEHEYFGSTYGGWDVISEDLNGASIVYSFGVGEDATFDVALIERFGMTVHAFDPTPKSILWVKEQGFGEQFVLHEYGIADFDGSISFNPPENPDHVSHTILERPETGDRSIEVSVMRIQSIMDQLQHTHIDLLKMDIEGAEYDVILDLVDSSIRPTQVLIEFHHRFPGVGIEATLNSIRQMREAGYQLFSISKSKEEFGFVLGENGASS